MLSAIINITERSRNRDYQNRSLMGREAPSHQNISFGICFRDHWLQLKVKAHGVEHCLILQLSSPGFLHQADPVIPLLFETFKRLPLSKKHHTPHQTSLFPTMLWPHFCFSNNQVRALTALFSAWEDLTLALHTADSCGSQVQCYLFRETFVDHPAPPAQALPCPHPQGGTTLLRTVLIFPSFLRNITMTDIWNLS